MISIYKYEMRPDGCVEMPEGARLLTVQVQRGVMVLWAAVDTDRPKVHRFLRFEGTGWEGKNDLKTLPYVATVQLPEGLVFHVFDCGEVRK